MFEEIKVAFINHSNKGVALKWEKYMRNNFIYFGITANQRRQITKPFLKKDQLPSKNEMIKLVHKMWQAPQREFQYVALDLLIKYENKIEQEDLSFFQYLITHKSWWDSVDPLATKSIGRYFKNFPERRVPIVDNWLDSENRWLHRSAIIFQLKYKHDLDPYFLDAVLQTQIDSDDPFIIKAIGWILREYSKTNPEWVMEYVSMQPLKPASCREALKFVNKKSQ